MAQLITTAQTLTTSWVNLGSEQDMSQHTRCAVWLNVDINDSNNVRVRAIPKLAKNATLEYNLPIRTVGASDVKVEREYYEFNVDADQQVLLEVQTKGLVPYVQFQAQVGTAGATPAQIDNADITFSSY